MKINDKTLIAYANSSSLPDREGYLQKKGEVNRGYQKRWFVLRGNLLFYYEKRGDKEPVGVIVLEECTIECHDSSEGFSFMIHYRGTNSRTYVLSSDTQEDMEAWMKALSCASYEYMKLLVSDLQRKLDEVNKVETSKLVKMGDRASNVISQTYDSAFNPKRNGVAVAEEALISFGNNSSPSESQNSTPSARFNPFDPPGSASAASTNSSEKVTSPDSSSTSVARPLPPPPAVRKVKSMPHDGPRTFNEMHEEFGQLIKLRLQQSVSEPPKRPPRKHPQTLSLDLSSNR